MSLTDDQAPTVTDIATAMKTLAETAKLEAEAAKVRQETELARLEQQTTVDTLRTDLETKRIANQKSEQDNQAARIDKLITWATAAVPDLSGIQKNTLTVSSGTVLFQGRQVAGALRAVAQAIAEEIETKVGTDVATPIYVSANPMILTSVAAYHQLTSEAGVLAKAISNEDSTAPGIVQQISGILESEEDTPGKRGLLPTGLELPVIAAGVGGAVAKQIASLFEVDTAATVSVQDIEALDLHVTVINELLVRKQDLEVRHQFARLPKSDSGLLKTVADLQASGLSLAMLGQRLDAYLKRLGDPAAKLADVEEALKKKPGDAELRATKAVLEKAVASLKRATAAKADLTAVVAKLDAFLIRISKLGEAGGPSPLQDALAVEGMLVSKAGLLILPPAKAECTQVVVSRRFLWPRLLNETTVTAKYLLVHGEKILATNQVVARVQDRQKVGWFRDSTMKKPSVESAAARIAPPSKPPANRTSRGDRLRGDRAPSWPA